jgi:ferrous iron transport protein B
MSEPGTIFHWGLVGAPNCGKTALFNALTGSRQKVANYPGVTVERKEGVLKPEWGVDVHILDLPGTYSLRARSPDEMVTRDVVLGQMAGEQILQALIVVVDASNLRLGLRLILEMKRVGRPVVVALNMIDIAERMGFGIDHKALSDLLGVPVIPTVATRGRGLDGLVYEMAEASRLAQRPSDWTPPTAADLRGLHAEAERIYKATVTQPVHPDVTTARLDRVLLHPVGGMVCLMALLFVMFQAVFTWAAPFMDGIEAAFGWINAQVIATMPDGLLRSFITDGAIAGVGSVLVFLPQILILFLFIILLEDSGYMARAAFLMDKIMGGAGLHGRAFIPLLSSFACAIPGIMAARVIDSKRDRLTTILVAPLMTCSARIPVYTLIISAFIPNTTVWGGLSLQGLVMFGLYASGITGALLVSALVRRVFWRGAVEAFMMELPTYKMPDAANVLQALMLRAKIFLRRAGGIIFLMVVALWVLSTFPYAPEGASRPAIEYSFAGMIGQFIQPALAPIGFNWQMAIALIPAMAAREVAVAALGTVYAIGDTETGVALLGSKLAAQWSLASGMSFLAWFIFAPQCLPTLAVVKRETGGWRWSILMFSYMTAMAYAASFAAYHLTQLLVQ